jgi:hypothetical protein
MSGKATGKVWDMRLGSGPRKTVLLAYADHADHEGKNMYPSVAMIVFKTEYSEATVHRCVKELIEMGLLVPDGTGPHNTNRYSLGCQTDTLSERHGVKSSLTGGVKSGDPFPEIGDTVTPELNVLTEELDIEREKENKTSPGFLALQSAASQIWPSETSRWVEVKTTLLRAKIEMQDGSIRVSGLGMKAAMYQDSYAKSFERALVGVLGKTTEVRFEE